jgi:UDP-N-acetylglucosamine--N-acetylmuramyl-(pentapeptide) pyrophosphoryl-undecaprenol N-acetylglucosamine transferase
MPERIVIAGGGTAGHVYPGLALAAELRARSFEVAFIGTDRGIEARLVPAAGFELVLVPASPVLRKLSMTTIRAPFVALRSVARCREIVWGARTVVGVGGYVSVSAVVAARREGVPVVLHEQNAVPGLANRTLARTARAVGLTFADAAREFPGSVRTVITGNPIRAEIRRVAAERRALAEEGRAALGLDWERRTILVFGGSQGALHLDRAAVDAFRILAGRADLQVVLVTGPAHHEVMVRALPASSPLLVRSVPYLDRMDLAYACADLVVSRAGATTIAEITACGLPALLIPYPYATGNHQEANARALQRAGGASVLLDGQLSGGALAARIEELIDDQERLAAMAERSRAFGRPDAAERLADLVLEGASS